jgi:hypothetical protein
MQLMLLQADAGKYGHTLIGPPSDPCGTMIFFENSYSLDTRSGRGPHPPPGRDGRELPLRRPRRLELRRRRRRRPAAQGADVPQGLQGERVMHALLIIMLAPLALTLGVVLIGALLDPRIWIMALIIAALLAIGLGLQSAKASVLPDEVFPALPGVGCESCGPRCVG